MDGVDTFWLTGMLLLAGMLSLAALHLLALWGDRRRGADGSVFAGGNLATVFLFEDERLVDATPAARQLLSLTGREGSAWDRLLHVLSPRFPALSDEMSGLLDRGAIQLTSSDGRSRIDAEWRLGLARLTLLDVDRAETEITVDRQVLDALEGELATLRGIAGEVPYPTWKEAADGRIVWANAAYLQLSSRLAPDSPVPLWPPHPVFAPHDPADRSPTRRKAIDLPGDGGRRWFDLRDIPMAGGVLRVAMSADAIVAAEQSRGEFVQTLTKTFGSLTVGLAIFDRNRRLQLFNPALTDLTALPPEFLIQQPSLAAFVDRLRDSRILPEPKNFESWRQRLSLLEAEAERGTFAETWTLPDGQVFEVTGRPHPDGAIAFLIQDVSAEMRLTRRFRSELQLNQAVLDTLDQAIAVFGDDGAMMLANAAYCRMWDVDTQLATRRDTLGDALRLWRTNCPTTPDWARLPVNGRRDAAAPLAFTAERLTGRRLEVRIQPLPNGALMAAFTEDPVVRRLALRGRRDGHDQAIGEPN